MMIWAMIAWISALPTASTTWLSPPRPLPTGACPWWPLSLSTQPRLQFEASIPLPPQLQLSMGTQRHTIPLLMYHTNQKTIENYCAFMKREKTNNNPFLRPENPWSLLGEPYLAISHKMKKENERKLSIFLFHMLKIQYFLSPYLQRKKNLNKNKTRKKPFSNHEGSIRVPEPTWKKRKKKS